MSELRNDTDEIGKLFAAEPAFRDEIMFVCELFAKMLNGSLTAFSDRGQPVFIGLDTRGNVTLKIPLCDLKLFTERLEKQKAKKAAFCAEESKGKEQESFVATCPCGVPLHECEMWGGEAKEHMS